jgi:hypothetical protein
MTPWMIVLTIVGLVVLPLVASFLMKTILNDTDHEGIYDELDS